VLTLKDHFIIISMHQI